MKIRELSVKNCLSFGDKGFNKANSIQLGDFNLFIGGNNAGKSNVLKLMQFLKLLVHSIRFSGNDALENIKVDIGGQQLDWIFGQERRRQIEFAFSLEIEEADQELLNIKPYRHEGDQNPISFMIELKRGWPKTFKISGSIKYKEQDLYLEITKVQIPNEHQAYQKEPILFDKVAKKALVLQPDFRGEQVWRLVQYLPNQDSEWNRDFSLVRGATYQLLSQLNEKIMEDLFINVGAIRKIQPVGDEVSETLAVLKEGTQEQRGMYDSVQKFVNDLIFISSGKNSELRFPGKTGEKEITIAEKKLVLPLGHYGSCVEQMLFLASKIVSLGSNKVILMEEPEAHFHPDLQRKFIKFLRENSGIFKHQYLIATHSNVFIDEFINTSGNVFYIFTEQDEKEGTKYSQIDTFDIAKAKALFRDLGAKPSDLLMTNGVFIVEGPIDKKLYSHWAKMIGKPFNNIGVEIIEVEGAGNISKYLGSKIIQNTCFHCHALCDKNAENEVRKKLKGIVADENIVALEKGDIEDYYPREIVMQFAREWGKIKGKKEAEIQSKIKEGETVSKLNELLNGDWWKNRLADIVVEKMKVDDIPQEIKIKLSKIYDSI